MAAAEAMSDPAASNTGGARMTETGMSPGTRTYMSPKQAMGERTLDVRTDIYALGCVVYKMLIGEPPFTGSPRQFACVIGAAPPRQRPDDLRAQLQLTLGGGHAVERELATGSH